MAEILRLTPFHAYSAAQLSRFPIQTSFLMRKPTLSIRDVSRDRLLDDLEKALLERISRGHFIAARIIWHSVVVS